MQYTHTMVHCHIHVNTQAFSQNVKYITLDRGKDFRTPAIDRNLFIL